MTLEIAGLIFEIVRDIARLVLFVWMLVEFYRTYKQRSLFWNFFIIYVLVELGRLAQ